MYSYWITVNYREAYGMFACNGILFNHESPRRGETFVTRKITKSISEIALGKRKFVALGNLSSLRDWGHAQDYVLMQWMMLQQSSPKDYVIATGEQYSVRDFFTWSAAVLGISIKFQGSGENEVAVVTSIEGDKAPGVCIGQVIAKVDKDFFRSAEVDTLLGDPALANADLNWCPKITVREMCEEMVLSDYRSLIKR